MKSENEKQGGVDLDLALKVAKQASEEARSVLLHFFGQLEKVTTKPDAGLVSEADQESERVIITALRKLPGDFEVLGEETGLTRGESKNILGRWIIDPLDGTTNYVRRFPVFASSIALEVNGKIVVGVVDAPLLHQTYWAVRGKGAFLNDQKLAVSQIDKIEEAFFSTGFAYLRDEELDRQLKIFTKMLHKSISIRRAGAAAVDLSMVASGVFDGFWERGLSPWDVAAASLFIEEAGGLLTDYEGKPFKLNNETVVAASPKMITKILEVIKTS